MPQIQKQVRTRRLNASRKANSAPKQRKSAKHAHSPILGLFLVIWAFIAFSWLGITAIRTAYAEMTEPIEYVATNELIHINQSVPQVNIETLVHKIDRVADEANIPRWKLHALVDCESSYNPKAKNINAKEESRGILQINRRAHSVTIAQAEDVDFSLQFAVDHWGERKSVWYNCSKKHAL